jgi:uncharacterized membrane protein YkvI
MAFYLRAESVPELAGLDKMQRRILLRGTFLKERLVSTLVLLGVIMLSVNFGINPLIQKLYPHLKNDQIGYVVILLAWLFLLMAIRDVVMMNILRPKIAAHRAKAAAQSETI